jgi:hypothetical protein
VAAHLSNRVPSRKNDYVNWAIKEWDWFTAQGFIGENNTINDGLLDNCQNNGATVYDTPVPQEVIRLYILTIE